ncbi:hypothetical protein BKA93DRAFT_275579 [Sparassis latifolia]
MRCPVIPTRVYFQGPLRSFSPGRSPSCIRATRTLQCRRFSCAPTVSGSHKLAQLTDALFDIPPSRPRLRPATGAPKRTNQARALLCPLRLHCARTTSQMQERAPQARELWNPGAFGFHTRALGAAVKREIFAWFIPAAVLACRSAAADDGHMYVWASLRLVNSGTRLVVPRLNLCRASASSLA